MFALTLAAAYLSNEALNAIIIAIGGSGSALIIARYTAKRQADKEDTDESRAFRGELREDNKSLREEVRDLKHEVQHQKEYIEKLESEMTTLRDNLNKARAIGQDSVERIEKFIPANGK